MEREDKKVNKKKINNIQYKEIIGRRAEYEEAIEYLKRNDLMNQADNLTKQLNSFKQCLDEIEKNDVIPVEKIPPKLSSEIFLNMPRNVRTKLFQNVINQLQEEKTLTQQILKTKKQDEVKAINVMYVSCQRM